MDFELSSIKTAGLAYAHALWCLSDIEPGDILVPLAFTDGRKGRELLRFDSGDKKESVDQARNHLLSDRELSCWALAYEGLISTDGVRTDALILEVGEYGNNSQLVVIQPFRPFSSGIFELLGTPRMVLINEALDAGQLTELMHLLRNATMEHEKALESWQDWHGW